MANIWFSGAESGDKSEITAALYGPIAISRTGIYCYQVSGSEGYVYQDIPPGDEFFIQFALSLSNHSPASEAQLFSWRAGSTILGVLTLDASLITRAYVGNQSVLVGTFSSPILNSAWVLFEGHFKIADDGVIEVRYNGSSKIYFSGDTKPGSETTINRFYFNSFGVWTIYYDDLVINDPSGGINNSWPNNAKIIRLAPNADGTTLNWAPSSGGNHYAVVDEVPASSSDFLTSVAVDQVDELGFADLPAEAKTIQAARVYAYAAKENDITPNQIALGVRVGTTNYLSTDFDLGTSYDKVSNVWELNPLTSAQWTPTEINNLQLVLKSR